MKEFLKCVLTKIPVFIFCVLFITGYNRLFGTENTVIGVAILTALLIFLQSDTGYNSKQSAVTIPLCLLLCVGIPRLSMINPYLGIPINFIAIMSILTLSSYEVEKDNHVPFLLGYVFAMGYPAVGGAFEKRIISALAGAVLLAIVYLAVNGKKLYSQNLSGVIKSFNIRSKRTQWYIKLSVVLTVVTFLGEILNYPNAIWVNFTVLSLTYHSEAVRKKRTMHRIPATILGSLVFYIIYIVLIPPEYHHIVVFATGFVIMFISDYFHKTTANTFNALSSAMLNFGSSTAILLRVISNIIGVLIAIINNRIFDRALPKMKSELAESK